MTAKREQVSLAHSENILTQISFGKQKNTATDLQRYIYKPGLQYSIFSVLSN